MDQAKIGRFIAECRKKEGLTQMQLAQRLNITDRAVSKWETGRSLPDSSIMLELCDILKIGVNDLLCGEVVNTDNYNKEIENNLLEMVRQKEESDRRLLTMEIVTGIACIIPLITAAVIGLLVPMEEPIAAAVVVAGLVPLLVATPFMLKIEQKAGYYVCSRCNHRHVPSYTSVFASMHVGRTRYMKCPECGKWSWQKKSVSKE